MRTKNRSFGTIALALVAAIGLWARPAQAGSRGHSGLSFSVSVGSHCRDGGFFYRQRGFAPAPYYTHYRSYRYPRGTVCYPTRSYRHRSYRHRGHGYSHRGRGHRNRCWRR